MSSSLPELPEFPLDVFGEHPAQMALQIAAKRHALEILSIVGGEVIDVLYFYESVAETLQEVRTHPVGVIEMTSDLAEIMQLTEDEKAAIFLRQHRAEDKRAENLRHREENAQAERDEYLRNQSSWGVIQRFMRDHPTGRHFGAILEKVDPIRPPKDPFTHITKVLALYGDTLAKVEPDFREFASQTGHPIVLDREAWLREAPPEEIAEHKDRMIFLNERVLQQGRFSCHVSAVIRRSILENTPEKLIALSELKSTLPSSFEKVIPDDIASWPARVSGFHAVLSEQLRDGLTIAEARALGAKYELDRYAIVMKTWLDERVVRGEVKKGRKGGKIAYFDKYAYLPG